MNNMKKIISFTIIATLLYSCNIEEHNPKKSFDEVSNFISNQFKHIRYR